MSHSEDNGWNLKENKSEGDQNSSANRPTLRFKTLKQSQKTLSDNKKLHLLINKFFLNEKELNLSNKDPENEKRPQFELKLRWNRSSKL